MTDQIPEKMQAVVCHGPEDYRLEEVAVPELVLLDRLGRHDRDVPVADARRVQAADRPVRGMRIVVERVESLHGCVFNSGCSAAARGVASAT